MKILTNLVKKNLLLNKGRTIITIISIILSSALICGVATLIVSFQHFFINLTIESNGYYHATINNFQIDKWDDIKNHHYIDKVLTNIKVGYAPITNNSKPYLYILAYDENWFENRPVKLIEGRLPRKDNEIIIDHHTNLKLGDKLTLDIGKRYINGEEIDQNISYSEKEEFIKEVNYEYEIVGIYEGSRYENPSLPGHLAITYISDKYITNVNYVNLSLIFKNPKNIFNKMDEMIETLDLPTTTSQHVIYHNELLRWYGVTDDDRALQILYRIGYILILVIMISSIIVIYNSFNISIVERKKQLGMLASIGATSKQISQIVFNEAIILSIIGIPIGILFGILGIGITLEVINKLNIFSQYIDTKLYLVISGLAVLTTIIFGSLTILISCLIPAIRAAKTTPIEAIKLVSDIKIKGKKLKTSKWIRKLFGIETELGLKNMKRNRGKYRSTIISIFVSIVLYMTINSFAEYSFRSSLKVFDDFNFNVIVEGQKSFYSEVIKLDNIKRYSMIKMISANLEVAKDDINPKVVDLFASLYNEKTDKYIINLQLYSLGTKEFEWLVKQNKDEIENYMKLDYPKIILTKISNYYDYQTKQFYELSPFEVEENDRLAIVFENKKTKILEVGKLTEVMPTGFGVNNSAIGVMIGFISDELFESLSDQTKIVDQRLVINSNNSNQLVKDINALKETLDVDANIHDIDYQVQQLKNVILAISIFLYGFIILVALIAITNVINTITTSIYLRKREFAMLKAIGMTDKDFNKMIRYESFFYGLKALIYGLIVGIFIDYSLYKSMSGIFIYDYSLPINSILVCIILVMIIILVTMMYSVYKIKSDNIIEVIRQENI